MNTLVYNNGTWPASFVGAAYPHMLDMMVWEGMGAPGKQYEDDNVMLGRSAWAGSQRYGGAVWSGDTHSSFNDLQQQFRAGLNMVMSGIPYWCVWIHPQSQASELVLDFVFLPKTGPPILAAIAAARLTHQASASS